MIVPVSTDRRPAAPMDLPTLQAFFERYQQLFQEGLAGHADLPAVAASYAAAFVAASPAGVSVGRNDEQLATVMRQGFERYQRLGTKSMALRGVRQSPIDAQHCVAHVAWTATYARAGGADVAIDFEVHYLMQQLDGPPRIFGWVSGDEEVLMRAHGIG